MARQTATMRTVREMGRTHVMLVSDTHLSPTAPAAQSNWETVLRAIDAAAPDLVIHLGDLSLDGAHDPGDLEFGRRQLDRLPARGRLVPGNHDVGDNPRAEGPDDDAIDTARRQRWTAVVGADQWSVVAGGWSVLGVNAQRRLRRLFAGTGLALVLSGHVHQYRWLSLDDLDHLWVPTTWAVLPDDLQPVLGAKRCGIVSLTLAAGAPPEHQLVEPVGLAQQMLIRDLPDPYRRRRATG